MMQHDWHPSYTPETLFHVAVPGHSYLYTGTVNTICSCSFTLAVGDG